MVDFFLETQKDANFNKRKKKFFWDTRDPLVSGNMVPRSCLIKQVGEKTDGKYKITHENMKSKHKVKLDHAVIIQRIIVNIFFLL